MSKEIIYDIKGKDITGCTLGNIVCLKKSSTKTSNNEYLWLFSCNFCGSEFLARKGDVARGDYDSCGCQRNIKTGDRSRTHGMARTTEYKIWGEIIQRCCNPNCAAYPNYGGRGIDVCDDWRESFDNFYRDMGERPTNLTIERLDNNSGYCKENCVWADKSTQAYNRRKISGTSSKYKNVYRNRKSQRWVARLWIDKKRYYVGSFNTEEEAKEAIDEYKRG